MKVSADGIAFISRLEGCKLKAYLDIARVPTIGVGHTRNVRMGMTCTKEQSDAWLKDDLGIVEMGIATLAKVPLTQNQYDALCAFVFNVGVSAFAKSTLLKKLNARDYDGAAREFAKWRFAGGKESQGLINRRAAEAALFGGDDGQN